MIKNIFSLIAILTLLMGYGASWAEQDPNKNMCGQYIKDISNHLKIIPEVVWAVAGTESYYNGGPWPWSANYRGKPYYFKDQKSLEKFIKKLSQEERNNLDLGCMQLNYRFHHWKFKDILEMINPQKNMILGTLYLYELYLKEKIHALILKHKNPRYKMPDDFHIWAIAVGHYHSHQQHHGKKYVKAVTKHLSPQPTLHTSDTVYDHDFLKRYSKISNLEKQYKHLLKVQKADEMKESSDSKPAKHKK